MQNSYTNLWHLSQTHRGQDNLMQNSYTNLWHLSQTHQGQDNLMQKFLC